jgi:threonyl-tRNA synthetase
LAPEQMRVLTVSEKSEAYGREIEQRMKKAGLRVKGDFRAEKLGAKIHDAQVDLIPYMLIVGTKDMEAGTVSIRDRDEGDLGSSSVDEAVTKFQQEIASRKIGKTFSGSAGLTERGATNEY